MTETTIPHAGCKTPSECHKEQICFDAWNCSSEMKPTEISPPEITKQWVLDNLGAAVAMIDILRRDVQRAEEERDVALGRLDLIREYINNV